uniref:Uncharacterized protein n=1 Tax=Anguilla anguilla TaxID=7936 RepID=A0A0E9PND8_ANGAN
MYFEIDLFWQRCFTSLEKRNCDITRETNSYTIHLIGTDRFIC